MHETGIEGIGHVTGAGRDALECWCNALCCWDGSRCVCPECCHNMIIPARPERLRRMRVESQRRIIRRRWARHCSRTSIYTAHHRRRVANYGDDGDRCFDCLDIPMRPGEFPTELTLQMLVELAEKERPKTTSPHYRWEDVKREMREKHGIE